MPEYLAAIWAHWVALMSGVVGLLLGIGMRVGRQISERLRRWTDIPGWIFIIVGVLCILYAGYQTWSDEHTSLLSLQRSLASPEFPVEVGPAFVGTYDPGNFLLLVMQGDVLNPHGPPSAGVHFKMTIEMNDGTVYTEVEPVNAVGDTYLPPFRNTGHGAMLPHNNFLPLKLADPIPAGGVASFWYLCVFRGLTQDKFTGSHAKAIISFDDVFGGHHYATYKESGKAPFIPNFTR
jgi:hypothetical protein